MNNFVTVITICYNARLTIEKTLESVVKQDYMFFEYIVVDGGSSDGTIDIIKKYSKKISHWISEPDRGIYDAMNKGIKLSKGQWIIFMNAGDSFYNSCVLSHLFSGVSWDDVDAIYGNVNMIYEDWNFVQYPAKIDILKNRMPFSHQAVFVRSILHKENPFSLDFKIASDYNFFYMMYRKKYRFSYVNVVISNYDAIGGISAQNCLLAKKENSIINGSAKTLIGKCKYMFSYLKIKSITLLPVSLYQFIRRVKRNVYAILNDWFVNSKY